jgi:hypothetical protein
MTQTSWKLNDLPIDQAQPATLTIDRGYSPSSLVFVVREELAERIRALTNPVTIEVTAPDLQGQPQVLKLEKWYITALEPAAPGFWRCVIHDVRWTAASGKRKLTHDYNVFISTGVDDTQGVYRTSSLNGIVKWTAYKACIDAIRRFGLTFEADPGLDTKLLTQELPRNLGNAKGGGFVGADFEYALPILAETIQLDLVPLENGSVTLTDRIRNQTNGLEKFIGIEGRIGTRDWRWRKPRKVRLLFEQRVERSLHGDEGASQTKGQDRKITNVMPKELVSFTDAPIQHVDLQDYMRTTWSVTLDMIRKRYFGPHIIDRAAADTPRMLKDKDRDERACKECFRLLWKVGESLGGTSLVDIDIGRLGSDGRTRSNRAVYMPYSYIRRENDIYFAGIQPEDLAAIPLSDNSLDPFTGAPAPFEATLGYSQRGELLIKLKPAEVYSMLDIYPGQLVKPVRLGDALALSDAAQYLADLVDDAELAGSFNIEIIYHGLLTEARADLGLARLHTIEQPLFADGQVDAVEYFVRDMTANHGLTAVTSGNVQLLNGDELRARAGFIAAQVLKAFEAGEAGVMMCGGVDAIVRGKYWVRGNITSLSILLGHTAPHTVTTQWTALPQLRPVELEDVGPMLQGPAIREIA